MQVQPDVVQTHACNLATDFYKQPPMHRLRCGVIYTNAFADYLATVGEQASPDTILALEYVRFASGPRKGTAWWRMDWLPTQSTDLQCHFTIGKISVFISAQSQRGLKERCLDWRDGQVVVRS
jgi:hypothetical protein